MSEENKNGQGSNGGSNKNDDSYGSGNNHLNKGEIRGNVPRMENPPPPPPTKKE